MVVRCTLCKIYFDDEFRAYVCPHDPFIANDGNNNFSVRDDSYRSFDPPSISKELPSSSLSPLDVIPNMCKAVKVDRFKERYYLKCNPDEIEMIYQENEFGDFFELEEDSYEVIMYSLDSCVIQFSHESETDLVVKFKIIPRG